MDLITFSYIVVVKVTVNRVFFSFNLLVSPYLFFPHRPLKGSAFKSPRLIESNDTNARFCEVKPYNTNHCSVI